MPKVLFGVVEGRGHHKVDWRRGMIRSRYISDISHEIEENLRSHVFNIDTDKSNNPEMRIEGKEVVLGEPLIMLSDCQLVSIERLKRIELGEE